MSSARATDPGAAAPTSAGVRATLLAFAIDAVLVLVFVLIGRASHGEGLGVLQTLWPFLAGLVAGHIVAIPFRAPFGIRWAGLTAWAGTVAGGLLLRVASDQGIQLSFVIVTMIVLAVFLLGWRIVRTLVVRARAKRA